MREQWQLKRPAKSTGDDGQIQGQDQIVYQEVRFSRETIGGQETEVAGQQTAITNYRLKMYGDPNRPVFHGDYLTDGKRRLNIQTIGDKHQNGRILTFICGERHDP